MLSTIFKILMLRSLQPSFLQKTDVFHFQDK
jgi:hypothetical protein